MVFLFAAFWLENYIWINDAVEIILYFNLDLNNVIVIHLFLKMRASFPVLAVLAAVSFTAVILPDDFRLRERRGDSQRRV